MNICYIDESGDTGKNGSRFFILNCIYMHEDNWQPNYNTVVQFRKQLVNKYTSRFPIKMELHTKDFLQDKKPYHGLYTQIERREIILSFFDLIANLNVKTFSIVFDKVRLIKETDIMDQSLTYLIQRIENDLNGERYIIITDEGRLPAMIKTARRIRKINFVPSQFNNSSARNLPIKGLLEDIFAKNSKDSYFLQLCDLMSYLTLLNVQLNYTSPGIPWANRVNNILFPNDIQLIYTNLIRIINAKISKKNDQGIYIYPS